MITAICCAAVIFIVVAFFLGRYFASKPIENRNAEIKKECELLQTKKEKLQEEYRVAVNLRDKEEFARRQQLTKLDADIQLKNNDIANAEDKLKRIENQYQDKLKVIDNTEQLAKEAYEKNMQVYTRKMEDEEHLYQQKVKCHNDEIALIKTELESLKATKAAAIEAARKEQEIHDNMEDYCLILPREEERDIPLLRDVQYKISKPRAIAMCIWSNYYQPIAKAKFPKILGKQDVCGIYKISNQKTGECYIGQAVDVRKRFYQHCQKGLGVDTPQGNKLYKAMLENGLENFSFELLLECAPNELDEKEKYFIDLYQANIYGMNGTAGNNGNN